MTIRSLHAVLVGIVCTTTFLHAAKEATLKTADSEIILTAHEHSPQLVTLRKPGGAIWKNETSEPLISYAESDGKKVPVEWNFNETASRVAEDSVAYVYESVVPHLRLTWKWEVRSKQGPAEHQITIENLESREVWIPMQESFTFQWTITPQDQLRHFYVEKGADTPSSVGTHNVSIQEGYSWEGTSSTYARIFPGEWREIIPYFMVHRDDGEQSGFCVGIEFSGRTHLTLTRRGSEISGEVGLNPKPAPFRTRVVPGGTFETPKIFLGAASGDLDANANVLRRWVREVVASRSPWKDPRYPFTVSNTWGGGMTVNDEIARRMLLEAASLGLEMFHIDAGWFRGVGDWYPNPEKFPTGLAAIADAAHAHGLKFGLWVDWTQAALGNNPGALNLRDPEIARWTTVQVPNNWQPEEFKGVTIDIGYPPAKKWALNETERIVRDYKLDMLEHDGYLVAQGCSSDDHPHAPPDPLNQSTYPEAGFTFVSSSNSTDVSYHAARSYYDIQSNLRAKHPGILLEICNDGGRTVDFGSAAHGDYFSITDTYDPLSNRRAFFDTSYLLPSAMLETYVEKWPTPTIENFKYMLRSGMMGWFTLMLDASSLTPEQHAVAKSEIELYKYVLRPLIRDAGLYHVSERPDGIRWDAMEYFDRANKKGVVYAFRGTVENESEHRFVLKGLSETKRYKLTFRDHSSADAIVSGSELMKRGLAVRLRSPNSSEIVLLEEVSAVE